MRCGARDQGFRCDTSGLSGRSFRLRPEDMAGFMAGAINTRTLVIEPPEMLDIIAELDEFKGAWRALRTLAPERLSALRRVATIESIGSSTCIEGSKLSNRDIEKILSNVSSNVANA